MLFLNLSIAWAASAQDPVVTDIEFRLWTRTDGTQESAIFRGRLGDVIKIRYRDGGYGEIPLNELAFGDQAYVAAVIEKFGPTYNIHRWTDVLGKSFNAELVGIDGSQLEFVSFESDRTITMEAVFLSPKDLSLAAEKITRIGIPRGSSQPVYRVWSYQDSRGTDLKCIGQFVRLDGERITLNQLNATFVIRVPGLSKADVDYLVGNDPTITSALLPTDSSSRRGRDDEDDDEEEEPVRYTISKIWWVSIGLICLLLLGIISIKYISDSAEKEWDDIE